MMLPYSALSGALASGLTATVFLFYSHLFLLYLLFASLRAIYFPARRLLGRFPSYYAPPDASKHISRRRHIYDFSWVAHSH